MVSTLNNSRKFESWLVLTAPEALKLENKKSGLKHVVLGDDCHFGWCVMLAAPPNRWEVLYVVDDHSRAGGLGLYHFTWC